VISPPAQDRSNTMAVIHGTDGDDFAYGWFDGTAEDDDIRGNDGNDVLFGRGGDDELRGQFGDDLLFGDAGADELHGGENNDRLIGGNIGDDGARDVLLGGNGDDTLYYSGEDEYDGGSGFDTFAADGPIHASTLWGMPDIISGPRGLYPDEPTLVEPLGPEGLRMDLERGVVEQRGTGAATEDFYVPGVLGIGAGDAEFISIERYELTDFGDYFAADDSADEIVAFDGDDIIEGRGGADHIDGGGGSDTIEYGGARAAVDVDLTRGTGLRDDAEGDVYVGIENIRGSGFGDMLAGDREDNRILGRDGDDVLAGRGGADLLDGGAGIDTADYSASPGFVIVQLAIETQVNSDAGGDAVGDRLRSVENVTGSAFGDIIFGNSRANTLDGGRGPDEIDGGFGNDILIGGQGTDTVSFRDWNDGYYSPLLETIRIELGPVNAEGFATRTVVNFRTGEISVAETDILSGFENVIGSDRFETIVGNSARNILEGEGGNDVLQGNTGGDTLNGGAGTDTASYESNPARVIAVLGQNGANGVAQEFGTLPGQPPGVQSIVSVDTLSGIESLRGSSFNDTLIGNEQVNRLEGGPGADVLAGGADADTFVWRNITDTGTVFGSADLVTDFNPAQGDRLDLSGIDANVFAGGNQTFSFIGQDGFSGTPGEINFVHVGNDTIIQMQTGVDADVEGVIRIAGIVTPQVSWFVL
jgi:Ca2+-binding RTX toxin-like protein